MPVYVIYFQDGRTMRIKAHHFFRYAESYAFFRDGKDKCDAHLEDEGIESVVAEDMLLSTISETAILPPIVSSDTGATDFARDCLFNDAEKTPFSPAERNNIKRALEDAEGRIRAEFVPADQHAREIHQKLDYLSRKVDSLDKFNWKRLLVTTLVGIAVDLGFGTFIPSAILELFKEVFSHFAGKLLKGSDSIHRS